MMRRISKDVESDELYRKIIDAEHPDPEETSSDAITSSACNIANTIGAAAIVNYTTSGSTTLRTARERPAMPILCLTEDISVARRMSLSFGVHAVHTKDVDNFADMVQKATHMAELHEIPGAVIFRLSPAASYIRGVSLAVDGGRLQSI